MNKNMIKFIDLKTGNTYSGEEPYIFWFPKGQGINMIYSMPICFISNNKYENISIPKNDIFKLVYLSNDPNSPEVFSKDIINDVSYFDITSKYSYNIKSTGLDYSGFKIHLFYIIAQSNMVGEFVENFKINGEPFKVGADFYTENESLYINLSNNGQDIPKEIQKALYAANIHEDKIDNILLNRKWKELLSNYWDVIANKGSYKSLINSLNWFGYNKDLISIYEVWKHTEDDKEIFNLRSLQEILSNKYFETLNGFAKTTHTAIHLALNKETNEYDEEKNPVLKNISGNWSYSEDENNSVITKKKDLDNIKVWSYNDLSLKLSMLGKFYETYFMPIHLNLIHCTIENVVYTNTIKITAFNIQDRFDYQYNTKSLKCNIKNGDIFVLGPVHAEAGDNTVFNNALKSVKSGENISYNNIHPIGVEGSAYLNLTDENYSNNKNDISLASFFSQYYNEIGVVVPFEIYIDLEKDDFIKKSTIYYNENNNWQSTEDYHIFQKTSNEPLIKFNILCTHEQEYDIRLQFESAGGKIYTYRVCFNVIDISNVSLKLYKICNTQVPSLNNNSNNIKRYWMNRQVNRFKNDNLYIQYIPAKHIDPLKEQWFGVALNNSLVIIKKTITPELNNYLNEHYYELESKNDSNITFISKKFGFTPDPNILNKSKVLINKNIFVPEFHKLVPIGENGSNISEYTITEKDTLCIIPELSFGKYIEDTEWEFVNVSKLKPESIKLERSIDVPMVSPTKKEYLDNGYYNVIFRYKLTDGETREMILNSAFRKI